MMGQSDAGPHGLRMWWTRPDGDVWLLASHDAAPPDPATHRSLLRSLALSIRPNSGEIPYSLEDPTMSLITFDRAGIVESRARVWSYRGAEVTLLVVESSDAAGHANLLELGQPTPVRVAGRNGWQAEGARADATVVGWKTEAPYAGWATLTIPSELSEHAGSIVSSLKGP